MSLMQNCLLFPMVGLKSEIFAFIAENFTVEVLLQNLWTTLYTSRLFELISIPIHLSMHFPVHRYIPLRAPR